MSSAATIRSDLDINRPPPSERSSGPAGNATRLFLASLAACERLDKIRPDHAIRDDLVR